MNHKLLQERAGLVTHKFSVSKTQIFRGRLIRESLLELLKSFELIPGTNLQHASFHL